MSVDLGFIPVIVALGGLLASLGSSYFADRGRKQAEKEHEQHKALYKKSFSTYFEQLKKEHPNINVGDNWSDLIEEYYASSIPNSTQVEYLAEDEIQKIVEEKVNHLNGRIEEIEQRFPSQDTVEKIASVNDAILATQIENLTEKVNALEKSKISKWDVAIVVFQIIATLGVLFGIILGVASYFAKTAGG
jgi:hypothetical protein